ncbi:MAG: SDR family oxidoreductase [Rhizomicrobium sp.]
MSPDPVLILGARSDIARAIAHAFARLGHPLQLAARNVHTLTADKTDLELRYRVQVTLLEFDAVAVGDHAAFVAGLPQLPGIAICAVGTLGDQRLSENDSEVASAVIRTNFEGPASILARLANCFAERGHGTLVGISSVAGERGRKANYVYGAAKAGFTAFLSGLRNRLATEGVHVVTVLPGFVATQMTAGMKLPALLTAQPEEVANAILKAIERKSDVIYTRAIWRLIIAIIRLIPEKLFKTSSL